MPRKPSLDNIWNQIDATGPCWLWLGKSRRGRNRQYGGVKFNGKTYAAHRFVYELLVGPIPDGLTLDHLCRVPLCVNPDHLEPVTQIENMKRGVVRKYPGKPNLRKTHCPRGHPYSGENLRITKRGYRCCRTCENAACLARYHERKRHAARLG